MSNDSATGGPLLPLDDSAFPAPLEDDALDDFFYRIVQGLTGLDAKWIWPRWQGEPPNLPPRAQDWASIGIRNRTADSYAAIEHDPAGDGRDRLTRHEQLELLVSFYGPNCGAIGATLRDGLLIAQNREALFLAGMGLREVGDLRKAPEMIKNAWYRRTDLTFYVRRVIERTYAVRNLLSADITITGPAGSTPITVNP